MVKFIIQDRAHKQIILIILGLIAIAYLINVFIPPSTVVFCGEYIFSFDYFGHIKNILTDYQVFGLNIDNLNCDNCPDFYHYSRWYSLFKIGLLSVGQLVGLHPFIFVVLTSIILQIVALYILSRLLFAQFSLSPFLCSAVFIIFYPYKFSLLVETHDGTLYGSTIALFAFTTYVLCNLGTASYKKLMLISVVLGTLTSTFLNINIAYLPIVFYMILYLAAIYIARILSNLKRSFAVFVIVATMTIAMNYPIVHSFLSFGNTRHYAGYISFGFIDSFLAGVNLAQTDIVLIYIISILIVLSLIFSSLTYRFRLFLFFIYCLIGIILMGHNSKINIFGWIFDRFPLADAIRSTYRFYVFQLTILFVLLYHSLQWFHKLKNRMLFTMLAILCLLVPLTHIIQHRDYLSISNLPREYFLVQKYLNTLPGKKIYFPLVEHGVRNLSNKYVWSTKDYKSTIVIYKNPFTSLLPVRDLVQFEKYPVLSPHLLELRTLVDMNKSTKKIIDALSYRDIEYLIYDENFDWSEKQYGINKNDLLQQSKLLNKFGSIYIFQIPKRSNKCIPSYGDFAIESCFSVANPQTFLNRTPIEYLLETKSETFGAVYLSTSRKGTYYRNILDPQAHEKLLAGSRLYSSNVLQIDGDQKEVLYTTNLAQGKYYLFVPMLEIESKPPPYITTSLDIYLNDVKVGYFSSNSSCEGVHWESMPIMIDRERSKISINTVGEGYIVLNQRPLLLTSQMKSRLDSDSGKFTQNKMEKCNIKNGNEKKVPL